MGNNFYNRGASFNPDELADGDAIEAEFDAVARGFDTIEDLVNVNKAGYPTQTFHVATATESTHAVPKAQMDAGLALKLNATSYTAADVLSKIKTVDGSSSGLDADLLDGQDGAYYRNATNINAGTLDKARLPASVDADTTGNAATATKTTATAPTGSSAELMRGTMGGNDYFLIRIGGNADAGWSEIATADNGTEPIYVRQYTGDFVTVARTATLLDGSGNTSFPGSVSATGFSGPLTGNASTATTLQTARTIAISGGATGTATSFNGSANISISVTALDATKLTGIVPDASLSGSYTGVNISGNAGTATTLQTARTINSVSFNGGANITVEPYVELDTGTAATRYLTFVGSSTAGYQRMNMDTALTYNPSTNVLGATISGNAGTASKLQTARTIALSGDVTGSVAFDGSANATITAALSDAGVLALVATSSAGGVGTYAFLSGTTNDYSFGATLAGSSLKPSGVYEMSSGNLGIYASTSLSGTWRCMGYQNGNNAGVGTIANTLWLRIA